MSTYLVDLEVRISKDPNAKQPQVMARTFTVAL